MKLQPLLSLLLILLVVGSTSSLRAQTSGATASGTAWTPCKAPVEVASRAYKRIHQAKGQIALQHERKSAFWDIHEFAHNCPEIKQIAAELIQNGLAADSQPPKGGASSGYWGGLDLPDGCVNGGKLICNVFLTKPGTGNTQGSGAAVNWFTFEPAKGSFEGLPKYQWKELDAQDLKYPKTWSFEKK